MSSGNVLKIVAFGMISMTPISLVAEDGWTTRADMPTARSGLTTSVVEGRVYAIGGDSGPEWYDRVSTVEELTVGLPPPRRAGRRLMP